MKTTHSLTALAHVGLTLVVLAALVGSLPAPHARATQAPQTNLQPPEALLNPDGTLDLARGFSGSLNAASGAPRFTRADTPLPDVNAPV
jgi:hypothetical protein